MEYVEGAEDLVRIIQAADEEEQDYITAFLSLAGVFDGRLGLAHAQALCEQVSWAFVGEAFDAVLTTLRDYVVEEESTRDEACYRGLRALQLNNAARSLVEAGHEGLDLSVGRGMELLLEMEEFFVQEEALLGSGLATCLVLAEGALHHQERRALALRIVAAIQVQHPLEEAVHLFGNVLHFYRYAGMTAEALRLLRAHFRAEVVAEADFRHVHAIFEIPHYIEMHGLAPRLWEAVSRRILVRLRETRQFPLRPDGTQVDSIVRTLFRMALDYNVMSLRDAEEVALQALRNTGGVSYLTLHNLLHSYRVRKDFEEVKRFYGVVQERAPEMAVHMVPVVLDCRMKAVAWSSRREHIWEQCFELVQRTAPLENYCVGSLARHCHTAERMLQILAWCEAEAIRIPQEYFLVWLDPSRRYGNAPRLQVTRDVYLRCLGLLDEPHEAVLAAALPHCPAWDITPNQLIAEFRAITHTWPSRDVLTAQLLLLPRHDGEGEAAAAAYAHNNHVLPNASALAVLVQGHTLPNAVALVRRFCANYSVALTAEVLVQLAQEHGRDERSLEAVVQLAAEMGVCPSHDMFVAVVVTVLRNSSVTAARRWYDDERFLQCRSEHFWRLAQTACRCIDRAEQNYNMSNGINQVLRREDLGDIPWAAAGVLASFLRAAIHRGRDQIAIQALLQECQPLFTRLRAEEQYADLEDLRNQRQQRAQQRGHRRGHLRGRQRGRG